MHVETLLIDHANCERKAASSALAMSYRYAQHPDYFMEFSRIVREEMRHFEQVLSLLTKLAIKFKDLSASRYASSLHEYAKQTRPTAVDNLLIAAVIEARSYERFTILSSILRPEIAKLYKKLQESERRHYLFYLTVAQHFEELTVIQHRLEQLLDVEAELISSPDREFRFHSGVPDNGIC